MNGPGRHGLASLGVARQKGVALVIVLWILLLVTISTGAYTLMARMDQLEAYTVLSGTQARLAAEAGMNMAILALRDPDETTRLSWRTPSNPRSRSGYWVLTGCSFRHRTEMVAAAAWRQKAQRSRF